MKILGKKQIVLINKDTNGNMFGCFVDSEINVENKFLPYCNFLLIPTSLLPLIHYVYSAHCSPEVSNLPSNSSYANLITSKKHKEKLIMLLY